MDKEKLLTHIRSLAQNDKDAIGMILSACADFGSESGALVSVKKFDDVADLVLAYLASGTTTRAVDLPCTCPKFENGSKVFPYRECDGCRKSANH